MLSSCCGYTDLDKSIRSEIDCGLTYILKQQDADQPERGVPLRIDAARVKSPLKAIINFNNDVVTTILYGNNICLAIKTTFEVVASDADVQAILREDSDFTHKFIHDLINKAIAQKEMNAEAEAETITDNIINAFAAGMNQLYFIGMPAR